MVWYGFDSTEGSNQSVACLSNLSVSSNDINAPEPRELPTSKEEEEKEKEKEKEKEGERKRERERGRERGRGVKGERKGEGWQICRKV